MRDAEATKVMSVEDPVELVIPGIHQVQARPAAGFTFAAALRSMLRRDPDVLYCAEVRDTDTAWLLARAALTGHLVITTLHAATADAALLRLLDVGVERYVLADSLVGVLAQRLIRTLCPDCRRPSPGGIVRLKSQGWEGALPEAPAIFEAAGCSTCHGTGYRGRRALHEFLPMTPELRRTMHDTPDRGPLQRALEAARLGTLRQNGLDLVARGITSLAEVDRVVPPE
jgi:type II secretory ATPase GspE/PulE/Tfp pilus assembly ATPase PilB-like protein